MKLLRLQEILLRIPIPRSAIYKLIASGQFPAPCKLGPRTAVWTEEQVDTWIREKICAGVTPSAGKGVAA